MTIPPPMATSRISTRGKAYRSGCDRRGNRPTFFRFFSTSCCPKMSSGDRMPVAWVILSAANEEGSEAGGPSQAASFARAGEAPWCAKRTPLPFDRERKQTRTMLDAVRYLLLCSSRYASLFDTPISFATLFRAAFSSTFSSNMICSTRWRTDTRAGASF
jgi:hypothetical protein